MEKRRWNGEERREKGEVERRARRREDVTSSSSGSSRPSLVMDTRFLPSNSFSCCTTYSSIGSVM